MGFQENSVIDSATQAEIDCIKDDNWLKTKL